MPTSAEAQQAVLVDTSVAVAVAVADHEHHAVTIRAMRGRALGLAGHAWFETFSVLTRLPPPARRRPGDVAKLLAHDFPHSRFLDAPTQRALCERLAHLGVAGGAVYDALVATAAAHHGMLLLTRDRRAVDTYRSLDVDFEIVA